VTIRGSFLLMAVVLGLVGRRDPLFVAAWVAIVFVSILIHELGHAFTARGLGAEVAIELNGIGGLTRWAVPANEMTPGRRALVAAAGSAVGVVFGGLVWFVATRFGPYSGLTSFVINNLIFINLFWGLINWLPIRPLDGGHLLEALLQKVAPNRAEPIARVVFTLVSGAVLAWAINSGNFFIAILAGWMLVSEFGSPRARQMMGPAPDLSYDKVDEPDLPQEPIDVEWEDPDTTDH